LMALLERPDIGNLTELEHADATGRNSTDTGVPSQRQFITEKLEQLRKTADPAQRLGAKPVIDGDVLKTLDFRPGPVFSKILDEARDAQREGAFSNAEDGTQWVNDRFSLLKGLSFNEQLAKGYGFEKTTKK